MFLSLLQGAGTAASDPAPSEAQHRRQDSLQAGTGVLSEDPGESFVGVRMGMINLLYFLVYFNFL